MGRKCKYLSIAVALTALNLLVALRYGATIWQAYADFLMVRLLLLLFAAVWITSLADLWSLALRGLRKAPPPCRAWLYGIAARTGANAEAGDV